MLNETRKKCLKHADRSFNQGSACEEMLATCTLLTVRDTVSIFHSPVGCSTSTNGLNIFNRFGQLLRERPASNARWISTNLTEEDTVFGGEAKLKTAIIESDKRYSPEAIFILTCVSGIIGDDIMAIASGSIDVGHSAWVAIINAKARGSEITAFAAPMGNSPESWFEGNPFLSKWIVLENSSIRSAKDLAGKKIAVNIMGAHVDYITREYLTRNGISMDQVQLVPIGITNHEQVLKQEQVDVVAPLGIVVNKIEESKGV